MQKHFNKIQCGQKGISTLAGIVIIVVVAAIAFGGVFAYQYFAPKVNNQPQAQNEEQNQNQQDVDTMNSAPNQLESLTESDILNATYAISANFGGKMTSPQNVVLPYGDSPDRLYITENGSVLKNPSEPSGEVFWIYKYEFTDSAHTQARVYVGGNYGASGQDNRIFIVKKTNGSVVTEEINN